MLSKAEVRKMREKFDSYVRTQRNILEKAKAEERGLTEAEKRDFDGLEAKMAPLEEELMKYRSDTPERMGSSAPTRSYRPGEARMLTRSERVAETITATLPDNASAEEFSIGRAIRGRVTGDWSGAELERRTMAEGSDTLGGFLLPSPVSAFYVDLARNTSALIAAGALTIPFDSESLSVPVVLSDPTAAWRGENQTIAESDVNLGKREVHARSLAAMVRVSNELLADSADLAGQMIQNGLTKALGLEMDRAGLRGQGAASEPLGIRYWPGVTVTTVAAPATPDYVTVSKAVTRASQDNETPNAYIVSVGVGDYLDRLTDSTGRWLGPPPSLTNLTRVKTNQMIDAEIIVGAFGQCALMPRQQIQIELSREASTAFEKNQTLIRAILRCDFVVFRANAFEVLTGITLPA